MEIFLFWGKQATYVNLISVELMLDGKVSSLFRRRKGVCELWMIVHAVKQWGLK
jgi:hypothetical protein